jgi:tetratricopeptide (TPR) repeat protein
MEDTTLRDEARAAEADLASSRPEQALARCQHLQTRYPRALVVQRLLGEAYLALRKPREALGALERALAGDPEDARACCARALIHQLHGDSTAALAWYRRACEIRPEDTMLREAYRELASHLKQPPYRPTTVGLARLYMRGELFVHAEREWETILSQQPERLDAQVGLTETLWRAGKVTRADELARRVLNNAHSCVKALLIVAALRHAAGDNNEAEQLLQRAAELDPERRIGLALYADRLAAGDSVLEGLLLGHSSGPSADPAARGRATGALAQGIEDVPTSHMAALPGSGQHVARPGSAGTGPLAGASSAGAQADLREVSAFAQSRVTAIPRDFHQIFAETEFMLWGREEDDGGKARKVEQASPTPDPMAPADSVPPFERSRADRFERSTVIVPPGLSNSEGGLEDTESRAAIGWVRWLQAQGARPIDGIARPSVMRSAGGTGPLPPPSREALRAMFAELDPSVGGPRVVDADPTPRTTGTSGSLAPEGSQATMAYEPPLGFDAADPARGSGADTTMSDGAVAGNPVMPGRLGESEEEQSAALWPGEVVGGTSRRGEPEEFAVSRGGKVGKLDDPRLFFPPAGSEPVEPPAGDPTPSSRRSVGARQPDVHDADTDLEAGSHTDAASMDGSPISPMEHDPWSSEASHSPDRADLGRHPAGPNPNDQAAADDLGLRAMPRSDEAESESPVGDGYLSRLRLARRKRADGRTDEALVEYRAILHDSPEALDDLIHDLRDLVAETENPEVHRLLGDAYIREGDYLRALESYNRALALTQGGE